MKVELGRIIAGATRDGLQKQSLVVARRQTFEDAPGEPVRTLVEYRYTFGPFVPGASFELVDFIAGLGTEQRDEILSARRDEMDSEDPGMLRNSVRVVFLRKADQEADGIDRALRCEADQAPGTLAARGRRDDVHRVVDLADPAVDPRQIPMRLPRSHPSQVTPSPCTLPVAFRCADGDCGPLARGTSSCSQGASETTDQLSWQAISGVSCRNLHDEFRERGWLMHEVRQSWLVQIYELSDRESQAILAGLLSGVPGLAVDVQSTPTDDFLVVDCVDALQAQWVFRLVSSIDNRARLIHTTNGSRPRIPSVA